MTDSIAELQIDLAALKAARRSGAQRVVFGNREVEYRTDKELATAIAATEAEIAVQQGATKPRNVVLRGLPNRGW